MAERLDGTYKSHLNKVVRKLPEGYQDLTHSEKIKLGMKAAKEHGIRIGRPEYWTETVALEFIDKLFDYLTEDESRIYIGEFVAQYGLHHQIISELENKFDSFSDKMKIIRSITESRILDHSSNGKRNPIFGMFVLKSKYNYNDRAGQMNTDGSTPIQINFSFTQPVNPSQIPPSNNTQPIIDITPDPNKIDNTDKDNE